MLKILLKIRRKKKNIFGTGAVPALRLKIRSKPIHVGPTSKASLSISVIRYLGDSE
jgi:hypothetical protein